MLVGALINFIGYGMTLPMLFLYLTSARGFSPTFVGLLGGLLAFISLIAGFIGGSLVDRSGPRRVLICAFILVGLAAVSLAWASTPWLAAGSVAAFGAAGGPVPSALNTLYARLTDEDERQRIFGLGFGLLNLGAGIGGLLGGLLVADGALESFQRLYLLDGLTCLGPALVLILIGESVTKSATPTTNRNLGAQDAVGGYRVVLTDATFRRFLVVVLSIAIAGYAQFEFGFVAFAFTEGGISARLISVAFGINALTIVAIQAAVIHWLEGRSRCTILSTAAVTFGVAWCILAVGTLIGPRGGLTAIGAMLVFAAVFAFAETLMAPVVPALANALASEHRRGRYNATLQSVIVLAKMLGPMIGVPLIGAGLGAPWIAAVILSSLVSAVFALRLRRHVSARTDGRAGSRLSGYQN